MGTVGNTINNTLTADFKAGNNLKILQPSDQIKELQTIIRDKYKHLYEIHSCLHYS